jgi:hypothetical protein
VVLLPADLLKSSKPLKSPDLLEMLKSTETRKTTETPESVESPELLNRAWHGFCMFKKHAKSHNDIFSSHAKK